MAESEDIRKRIRRLNPKALAVIDEIDKQLIKLGCQGGITVTVTGDMTRGEEEMAIFEGFLKEGYSPDAAEAKAKKFLNKVDTIFNRR